MWKVKNTHGHRKDTRQKDPNLNWLYETHKEELKQKDFFCEAIKKDKEDTRDLTNGWKLFVYSQLFVVAVKRNT